MILASISEIKSKMSYYLNLAIKDNEIITICNHNTPIAEIKALDKKKHKVKLGVCNDKIELSKNFNKTSKEIINSFYTKKI